MAHILLIDDDTELTSLLTEVLQYEGFEISQANDGEAGLAAVSDEIDLILLDVMMPKLNGMETLKRLREKWATAGFNADRERRRDRSGDRLRARSG